MAYIKLPITGIGTANDPFRPAIPANVASLPGLKWSAHIPGKPDGTPQFADCYVWVPDSFALPGKIVVISKPTAQSDILSRDSKVDFNALEMK